MRIGYSFFKFDANRLFSSIKFLNVQIGYVCLLSLNQIGYFCFEFELNRLFSKIRGKCLNRLFLLPVRIESVKFSVSTSKSEIHYFSTKNFLKTSCPDNQLNRLLPLFTSSHLKISTISNSVAQSLR